MSTVEEIQLRTGLRGRKLWTVVHLAAVRSWRKFCCSHERHHIDIDTLHGRGISVYALSWNAGDDIDFEQRFSQPLSSHTIEQLYRRTQAADYYPLPNPSRIGTWWWLGDDLPCESPNPTQRLGEAHSASWYIMKLIGNNKEPHHIAAQGNWMACWGGGKYYPALESEPTSTGPQWRVRCYYRSLPWPQKELPTDPKKLERLRRRQATRPPADWDRPVDDIYRRPGEKPTVHLGVVVVDSTLPREDSVTIAEMQAALTGMEDQNVQHRNWRSHAIFPVFVYSFVGLHVRVLQMHIDPHDCRLIVRKTSFIKISGPEAETEVKLLLQWMTAKPTGKTTFEELDINFDDEQSGVQSRPSTPRNQSLGAVEG